MAIVKKAQQMIGNALKREEGPLLVAEKYAAAYGFGFVKGYYRERASFRGVPADLLAGIAGVAGAAVLEVMSNGKSNIAPHLSAVGDAGIMSYLGSMGASMGAKKSGRQVYVLNSGAAKPAQIPAGMSAVGELPQAVGGAYLSADDIARFSAQR